jgi:exodeoxyribonuclease V gamma subunit
MSGLTLYNSNRLEKLADLLAGVLKTPLPSPLTPEIILVQSRGMERWVSLELARRLQVCANIQFPFPNDFVSGVFRNFLPDLEETPLFAPEVMVWRIMKILPSILKKKGFAVLRHYLSEGPADLKLFQLSQRLADLFDQYLLFRPEMIFRWEKGEEDHWQAVLWREMIPGFEKKHRAALQKIFLEEIRDSAVRPGTLPARLTVFGISALPRFHVEILAALSQFLEVNLFLMNPCREYWGSLLTRRETHKARERAREKHIPPEQLHLSPGNSLLASLGRLGQDFFEMIMHFEPREEDRAVDPGEQTLLHRLQQDILFLRESGAGEGDKKEIDPQDHSIQIHSCHSPMREVEVLQDRLLSLFETDPGLLPKDVLVMTPDLKTYAPYIQAVFSVPQVDPRWIPFSLADRGMRQESPVADSFLGLLDFRGSRFEVSKVMAILESPPVRRRFSLIEDDLIPIRRWIRDTRIRWGVDGEGRKALGLPGYPENTWAAGLERMLLGYALPRREDRLFLGILPYDRIEGSEAAVLGRFVHLADRLFALVKDLGEQRTLAGWGIFLTGMLEDFFLADEETERDLLFLRRVLRQLGERQEPSGFDKKIDLEVIQSLLGTTLEQEGFGTGFLTGGLTFCAMLPMRSIPFKVIGLLGMNDDAYPRPTRFLGFDLLAKHPQPGDRSRRNDDRYLFLEVLLSAREKLHLSYVGQSIRDNNRRPPSVLISELLDTLEAGYRIGDKAISEQLIRRHPLQAFSPEYFKKSQQERFFSYSTENLEAARQARNPRAAGKECIATGLPEPPVEWRTVAIGQLIRFFGNPTEFIFNQRLGIYLRDEGLVFEETEPFEVQGLEKYDLEQGLVERGSNDRSLPETFPAFRAAGQLPHGRPGECFFQGTCQSIADFLEELRPFREGGPLAPLEVDLALGEFRVVGRIDRLYPRGLLHFRYAKVKPKDRLRIWILHLLVNRIGLPGYPQEARLFGQDKSCGYPPVKDSEARLLELLELYWQGLQRPLHFFPYTSWVYVEALWKEKEKVEALRLSRAAWEGSDFSRGEGEDPYYQVCFEHRDPLDEEFQSLAERIFRPLRQGEAKP